VGHFILAIAFLVAGRVWALPPLPFEPVLELEAGTPLLLQQPPPSTSQTPGVPQPVPLPPTPSPNPQQSQPAGQSQPAQTPPATAPRHILSTVVLDPGHGGSDSGARGANGVIEKDITLVYARAAKIELEKQGFHVVMTRQADEDPSFDDRAGIANAQHNAVFISFHVSSTGTIGTVRTYFYQFGPAAAPPSVSSGTAATGSATGTATPESTEAPKQSPPMQIHVPQLQDDDDATSTDSSDTHTPPGLILWSEAQRRYVDASHKLADLVQMELAKTFKSSQQLAIPVPERDLRSVATPAVAVEVSSVAVDDPMQLTSMAGALGEAVARAVAAYRPIYEQNFEPGTTK
jgi:N-acetylmuramoyl-L-alanine amidase